MRDDYKLKGQISHMDVDVEQGVAEKLRAMAQHTGLSVSELANTALKRFITHHSDFLPASELDRLRKA